MAAISTVLLSLLKSGDHIYLVKLFMGKTIEISDNDVKGFWDSDVLYRFYRFRSYRS